MRSPNDGKNPHVWIIGFISIIPTIIIFSLLDYFYIFHLSKIFGYDLIVVFLIVIISILPVSITYKTVWSIYCKSEDYKKRHKNKKLIPS